MASSDLIYPYPSSVSVSNFVSVKPSVKGDGRRNFKNWKAQMVCLLEGQDVVGFVDGEIVAPAPEDEQQRKLWRRTDVIIKGWILGSVGADVVEAVRDMKTARDIWLELEDKLFKEKEDPYKEDSGDFSMYLPLYQAALRGDWDMAKNFFEDINELSTTTITTYKETALHLAVSTGKANGLVSKLLEFMPLEALALKDSVGNTALHNAAIVGNIEAVCALVKRSPDLLHIPSDADRLPVQDAVTSCQKKTVEYLIAQHEAANEKHNPLFEGQRGVDLLVSIISSEFVDIALDLAYKYPHLALLELKEDPGRYALSTIAQTNALFPRTETLNWWHKFIYHRIPQKKFKFEAAPAQDIENSGSAARENYSLIFQIYSRVAQKVELMFWNVIKYLVPSMKKLSNKKTTHQQALQLVECLCNQIVSQKEAAEIFAGSIFIAASYGISEIVEMIIDKYPSALYYGDSESDASLFHVAAKGRFENIINLMNNISDRRYVFFDYIDKYQNNLIHMCGEMAPPERLNLVPGAALQMQRELQWFKKMEEFVHLSRRTGVNKDNKTPQELFTECHRDLKADGERWMKDTANACTIAAALIATVMFAAAFTVPGGVESATGIPLFLRQSAFDVFSVADALSLFTSATSLLMFLSILTSRYAEEDFLRVLPQRLSMGLLSLFASITFMMVAFSAALFLMFRRDAPWFVALVAVFACLPVTSFVLLQFPLLLDVTKLTFGPGIFCKKNCK